MSRPEQRRAVQGYSCSERLATDIWCSTAERDTRLKVHQIERVVSHRLDNNYYIANCPTTCMHMFKILSVQHIFSGGSPH